MNILMILPQFESARIKLHTANLLNKLMERGHKVSIIGDSPTENIPGEHQNIDLTKKGLISKIMQIKFLIGFIRKNDIQIVHDHSERFHWSVPIACEFTGTPLVTTLHKKASIQISLKILKRFWDYSFTTSEDVLSHLVKKGGVDSEKIEVLRYGLDISKYKETPLPVNEKKVISIISRLSDFDEELLYKLLKSGLDLDRYLVYIIGIDNGLPPEFNQFKDSIKFLEDTDDISKKIRKSDLIIGKGEAAVEGILSGRPVLLASNSCAINLIKKDKLIKAMKSNFEGLGIDTKDIKTDFDLDRLNRNITKALQMTPDELHEIRQIVKSEYDLKNIVRKLEIVYQKQIVLKRKKDIPILVYNRVVQDKDLDDTNNSCIGTTQFDEHMKILKDSGYEIITFKDYEKNKFKTRFDKNKKQIMITFDGCYEDNYFHAFPILKKYDFRAVIYLISHLRSNKWDIDNIDKHEKEFYMMNRGQIKEMQEYGIEFGGHTKTHVKLSRLDPQEAREEIIESTDILEELLGEKLLSFSYPYGVLTDRIKQIVEEAGYKFAVTLGSGSVCFSDDLYAIRRIPIDHTTPIHEFKRKIDGNYNFSKMKK